MTGFSGPRKARVMLGKKGFHILIPAKRAFQNETGPKDFLGTTKLEDAFMPAFRFWGLLKL